MRSSIVSVISGPIGHDRTCVGNYICMYSKVFVSNYSPREDISPLCPYLIVDDLSNPTHKNDQNWRWVKCPNKLIGQKDKIKWEIKNKKDGQA